MVLEVEKNEHFRFSMIYIQNAVEIDIGKKNSMPLTPSDYRTQQKLTRVAIITLIFNLEIRIECGK